MIIGQSVKRKENLDKVTGNAKYTADFYENGMLYARVCTSKVGHAIIKNIDISKAKNIEGVYAIITGKDVPVHMGILLEDRPVLAIDKVRYYGEPVAIVVASNERIAENACELIEIEYKKLPVINDVRDAIKPNAFKIHQNLMEYVKVVEDVFPEEDSNIASCYKIRKGNINTAFSESDVIVEKTFSLKKTDHIAMELRVSDCEISASGVVTITSSTQSPYTVKEMISKYFAVEEGNVVVKVPLVGGAFGGKSPMFLEALAFVASQAVGRKKGKSRSK